MIGALGSAGTPEAQHELARLLDTQAAGDQRVNAAIALSLTNHPTDETAEALKKATASREEDIANTAILASGNVVRTMNTGGKEDTVDALQQLIDGLARAIKDSPKQVYLENDPSPAVQSFAKQIVDNYKIDET